MQATGPVVREYPAFESLDLALHWRCEFWKLYGDDSPMPELQPNAQLVQPLFDTAPDAFFWGRADHDRLAKIARPAEAGIGLGAGVPLALPPGYDDEFSEGELESLRGSVQHNSDADVSDNEVEEEEPADAKDSDSDAELLDRGDLDADGGAPPEVPPPVPPPDEVDEDVPFFTVQVEGGHITWYRNTNDLVATCSCGPHQPRCRRTRTANIGAIRWKGRPLGFLLAWLVTHECASKADHDQYRPSVAQRRQCRQDFKTKNGSGFLRRKERRRHTDEEDSEPERA